MTDVLIIGAGQAGLAMGQALRGTGLDFLLLDAGARVGDSWRARWDSLRLFTPARRSGLPGLPFPGAPGRYPGKDEVADYLAGYAEHFALPVEHGVRVGRLRRTREGWYDVDGRVARSVVIATGPFRRPFTPPFRLAVPQVHSADYRRPEQLPDGPVLVVGGGNSGVQIAAELAADRPVTLSAGTAQPVVPQRILGLDAFTWLDGLGIVRAPVESRLGRRVRARDPLIGMGPRGLRRLGVRIVGRVTGVNGGGLRTADGEEVRPAAVVWATGFRPDFGWVEVPGAVGPDGWPVHRHGVSPVAGLSYVGLPYQRNRGSALLGWVGEDAAVVRHHLWTDTNK